jgi:hypothetical protein
MLQTRHRVHFLVTSCPMLFEASFRSLTFTIVYRYLYIHKQPSWVCNSEVGECLDCGLMPFLLVLLIAACRVSTLGAPKHLRTLSRPCLVSAPWCSGTASYLHHTSSPCLLVAPSPVPGWRATLTWVRVVPAAVQARGCWTSCTSAPPSHHWSCQGSHSTIGQVQ